MFNSIESEQEEGDSSETEAFPRLTRRQGTEEEEKESSEGIVIVFPSEGSVTTERWSRWSTAFVWSD